ncbi:MULTISPECIES: hypothetical protein [Haloferax]|uniref:Uncharacterized protein n=1 Tax=Haloferax marinum TaxID=2666143 RepID=A0A6A8G7E8_9EURY|nr:MULTISPECIES: hypothetical protein [Haloferax]KAB1198133.1 hypothetical protein Hfx1150_11620 [Haloferax sp. CBA1150]MRW97210.1 hypothetical protein [Haloferax marinum]
MRQSRLHWIIILLGVAVFLASIPLVFWEFGQTGLNALSIVSSTLLTIGLVVLYWQQHRVLRYQQLPQLEISEFNMFGNFEIIQVDISNVGGGPATSMTFRIDIYELSGEGPLQTTQGRLRRIESLGDGSEKKTRASSIRPSEINISFETESKGALGSGARTQNQKSLASIVAKEFEKGRDVLYGKVLIEYHDKFSQENTFEADFALKFTRPDELEYEVFDFQPWADDNQQPALGG